MELKALLRQYLPTSRIMQLATVHNGSPWLCTVHYIHDENLNFYWLSLPTRRHSQELAANPQAAIAVAIKADLPVVGVQAEGKASQVTNQKEVESLMKDYVKKFGIGQKFYDNFVAGKNQHVLYRFTPETIVLFDEVNFPDDGRQEWRIN